SQGSRGLRRCRVPQACRGVDGLWVRQFWAICCREGWWTFVLSPEFLQQPLGLLEVGGVKSLRGPAVGGRQRRVGFGTLALLLPAPTQTHGGPQLQRFRLLTTGHGEGLLETGLGLRHLRDGLLQQLTREPM